MSGQPTNMADLVLSVTETAMEGSALIPTFAFRRMDAIGSAQRTVLQQALTNLRANYMNLGALAAGTTTQVPQQTDVYYRDNDIEGNFMRLQSVAMNAARGKR